MIHTIERYEREHKQKSEKGRRGPHVFCGHVNNARAFHL